MTRRLGDRVERAIDQHADVEHAVARAAAEPRRSLGRTAVWLALTGISLYLVVPSVIEVLGSYDQLERLPAGWLVAMVLAQGAALICLAGVQRLAIGAGTWRAMITSQLAGNALAKVAPGGGALGAALQYRMLASAGLERRAVVSGLTASSLLTFAVVLALPVLALPALLRGAVARDLLRVGAVGLGLFAVLATVAIVLLASDGPIGWLGRAIQRVRNRLRPSAEPLCQLPDRLVRDRDRILGTIGPRWKRAVLASVGRWTFDYATLLAAVAAVGAAARPGLVLLAFCAAQVLSQIPVTPGGLGFVEAGLTSTLALAGMEAGDAVLAAFAYRLASYWLPLPVGWGLHRRHHAPRLSAGAPSA